MKSLLLRLLFVLVMTGSAALCAENARSRCETAQRGSRWAEALTHAREWFAVAQEPDEFEHALQVVLLMATRSESMAALIEELSSPRAALSARDLCLLAWMQHVSGDHILAVTTMREAAARDAVFGWRQLSRLYFAGKHYAAAADSQMLLVESEGGDTPANLLRLVELMWWSSREERSLHWLGEWKKRHPDSAEPWMLKAYLHTSGYRDVDALAELEHALQRWPKHPELLARCATTLEQLQRGEDARQVWLKLYDATPLLADKLHWLPWMIKRQYGPDGLKAEFEQRRREHPNDPAPLTALAEYCTDSHEHDESLKLLREAVKLAPREPALLSRAALAALAAKEPALAESFLLKAEKHGGSAAARQQRALVLLVMKRGSEAGSILKGLAGDLDAEPLAELAVALTHAGFGTAAAQMLRHRMMRFPDDYRLAWLRVEILLRADATGGLADECLRLATTAFPAMPVPLLTQPKPCNPGRDGPYLQPDEEPVSMLVKDEPQRVFRTMCHDYGWREGGWEIGSEEIPPPPGRPRMPALPADVRALAARVFLHLARQESPAAFDKSKARLIAAGVPGALLEQREPIGMAIPPEWRRVNNAYKQYPEHGPLLLRLALGEIEMTPELYPLARLTRGDWRREAEGDLRETAPAAIEAWKTFRRSDPVFAVYAALKFASSSEAVERRVAEEALEMLEPQRGGPLLRGAVPHFGAAVVRDDLPSDSLLHRLRSHLVEWADAAPAGELRDQLQHYAILHTWKGSDPAAHLERAARMLASDSDCDPKRTHIPRWLPPPVPSAPPAKADSTSHPKYGMYDPAPGGIGSPAVPWDEALPAPGQNLLHVPPALPGMFHRDWENQRPGRLVRAALLLPSGPWSADKIKLRAALDAVTDLELKAVAALATEDASFITACMDALLAAQGTDEAVLTFAAAAASRQRQQDRTATLLLRLSSMQPADAPRDADTAIAGAAHLLIKGGESVSETMRHACGEALDRLATFPFKAQIHEALGGLAERLGMASRAQVFRKAAVRSRSLPSIRRVPAFLQPTVVPAGPLKRLVPVAAWFQQNP